MAESFPAPARDVASNFLNYFGNFVLSKGATKYVAIYGTSSLAALVGYAATGGDIVRFPNTVFAAVDTGLGNLSEQQMTYFQDWYSDSLAENVWLPVGYFVKHINSLSVEQAFLELSAFMVLGLTAKFTSERLQQHEQR